MKLIMTYYKKMIITYKKLFVMSFVIMAAVTVSNLLIPGLFLILLFLCLTEIGSWCQERMNHKKRQM